MVISVKAGQLRLWRGETQSYPGQDAGPLGRLQVNRKPQLIPAFPIQPLCSRNVELGDVSSQSPLYLETYLASTHRSFNLMHHNVRALQWVEGHLRSPADVP